MAFKSGFASIAGAPNVGKSTFLNRVIGEKITITSPKPQTTRFVISGVLTDENSQIIFLDTPGIHTPKNNLGKRMVTGAFEANKSSDIILFMIDAPSAFSEKNSDIIPALPHTAKIFMVINKVDIFAKSQILPIIAKYSELHNFAHIFPISAKDGTGVEALISAIRDELPEGEPYFPSDTLTDQPERVIVSEFIREKCMRLLGDEIPFGISVEIEEFDDAHTPCRIRATILCAKESHKSIIIGKNGAMIKAIGTRAKASTEKLLGTKVHLDLWVKHKS
ncbi:MAG: GTPase Era [Clostridiales bacterium]|jgi:GTP-binding protein Era|nr:GTPase Era [Clostridiales bacterium]